MRKILPVVLLGLSLAHAGSAQDLVSGGHFDTADDLNFFDEVDSSKMWVDDDVFGDLESGAVRLQHSSASTPTGIRMTQCISVVGGERYELEAYGKRLSEVDVEGHLEVQIQWYSEKNCAALIFSGTLSSETTTTDAWELLQVSGHAPAATQSARLDLYLWKTATASEAPLVGFLDEVSLQPICLRDSECDDGFMCNGYERCRDKVCVSAPSCETAPGLECVEEAQACMIRWSLDFQGDSNHAGFSGQTDPVDYSEGDTDWSSLEVQAVNSSTASDSDSSPFTKVQSSGGTGLEAQFFFTGEVVGWSGTALQNALTGDYWVLTQDYGVETSLLEWSIQLPADTLYDLTFLAGDDKSPERWITHSIDGGEQAVQSNEIVALRLRATSAADGLIRGLSTGRPAGQGHWSGLQISTVPLRRFLIDFQGNEDHAGLFGQTDPLVPAEAEVWNVFDVQAFNSSSATEYETDPQLQLVDVLGGDSGVRITIDGDIHGWAGWLGDSIVMGDYLLMANAFGVNTNELGWELTGLEANEIYRLTFYTYDNGFANRAVRFEVGGHDFTVRNLDESASVDVVTDGAGRIAGSATNAGSFEGNWSGLEILDVPEPATGVAIIAALITLSALTRSARRRRVE